MSDLYSSKVLNIAKAEVGYIEKKSNKNLDSKKANAGSSNFTKYNRDMKKIRKAGTITDYWCANFVCWCFVKAYGTNAAKSLIYGFTNYVPYIYDHFKAKKRIYKTPKKGDIVIFRNCAHVGIVYNVKGKYVYTIEGNTSSGAFNANGGAVCKKKYSKTSAWIKAYARPKYNTKKTAVKKTVVKTATKTISKKVEPKKKKTDISKYPTLKKGSKGSYVKKLQKKLKITADGDFGAKTEAAVKKFQKKHKLTADGVVGQKTWKKLIS